MKRSIASKWVLSLVVGAAALAALPAWAEGKMAVVDFQRLAQESPQGKAIMEAMRAEFSPRERTLQAQAQALKAKSDKYQKDSATMSEDQKARAEKELRDGQRDFERARSELQDDVTARRNEEMSRLQRTLVEEVRTYAKAQNYDLVVSTETVLFSAPSYDITAAVLAALQSHAAAPAAAAPAKPAAPKPNP